ncbi:MAG: DUF6264 family protein [Microbacterium sp.]
MRPRPQYGEYATPEQQRASIRQPAPEDGVLTAASAAVAPHAAVHRPHPPATTTAARPSRTADRVVTIALLAYGLATVLSALPQLWDFAQFAQTWMEVAGVDATFTNTAQGDTWGRAGAIVLAGGWALTALISWRSLRAGRLAWWIPLVGAIATYIAASLCLVVPLLGDPAVLSHFGG